MEKCIDTCTTGPIGTKGVADTPARGLGEGLDHEGRGEGYMFSLGLEVGLHGTDGTVSR
jgi:hypothetical protein